MATEKKKRKPAEEHPKQVLKITRRTQQVYIRGKELLYYDCSYVPLTDSIMYTVNTSYGKLDGELDLVPMAQMLRISVDKLREFMDLMWIDISDLISSKIITLAELDKTVPPEVGETDILDISGMYRDDIISFINKSLGR